MERRSICHRRSLVRPCPRQDERGAASSEPYQSPAPRSSWNIGAKIAHCPPAVIRSEIADWLGRAHGFLSAAKGGRAEGEAVAAVILDGWMAGAGAPRGTGSDVLGAMLNGYTTKAFTTHTERMWSQAAALLSQQVECAECSGPTALSRGQGPCLCLSPCMPSGQGL